MLVLKFSYENYIKVEYVLINLSENEELFYVFNCIKNF